MSLFDRQLAKNGKDVTFEDRNEKIFNGGSTEVFSNPVPARVTMKTIRGVSVFDSTNTERVATHEICLYFIAGITSEKWIRYGTKLLKILTVENICEGDKRLRLMCTERGEDSKVVNSA